MWLLYPLVHMPDRQVPLLVLLLFLVAGVAGCVSDPGDSSSNGAREPGAGGPQDAPGRGSISGVVIGVDGPLQGARVEISRIFESTTTDSQGRFAFDDLLAVDYRVSVTADHHRRASTSVQVQGGQQVQVELRLNPVMLTPEIPAVHGKQVVAVNTQDTLFASVGLPLLGLQQAFTNETKEATFPGFWEIEPEPGYRVAQISVVLAWANLPELDQALGLQYFRGESPLDNELVETATTDYHMPDPAIDGGVFALYTIKNDDWDTWGKRHWQLGVYIKEDEGPALAGAAVEHIINIVVTYVSEDYNP
jgi:hypothetical protein